MLDKLKCNVNHQRISIYITKYDIGVISNIYNVI